MATRVNIIMNEVKNNSIDVFLNELASKQATPGGGSTAALMGAQAAALVSMVCNLTIGKPKYAEVETEMQALLEASESLRKVLVGMIQEDVKVFDKLMQCYGLPKDSEDEKTYRSEQIQMVLKEATRVPLDCAKACIQVIDMSRLAAEKGSLGVVSDAGVAVMAGFAGFKSAALNVYINAASLKDRAFAEECLAELNAYTQTVDGGVGEIYQIVKDRLKVN